MGVGNGVQASSKTRSTTRGGEPATGQARGHEHAGTAQAFAVAGHLTHTEEEPATRTKAAGPGRAGPWSVAQAEAAVHDHATGSGRGRARERGPQVPQRGPKTMHTPRPALTASTPATKPSPPATPPPAPADAAPPRGRGCQVVVATGRAPRRRTAPLAAGPRHGRRDQHAAGGADSHPRRAPRRQRGRTSTRRHPRTGARCSRHGTAARARTRTQAPQTPQPFRENTHTVSTRRPDTNTTTPPPTASTAPQAPPPRTASRRRPLHADTDTQEGHAPEEADHRNTHDLGPGRAGRVGPGRAGRGPGAASRWSRRRRRARLVRHFA